MAVSPTPPLISVLPPAPLPTDPEAVFDAKAGVRLTAEELMVTEQNAALAWQAGSMADTKGYKDAAATSAGNAADSATLAGEKVGLAADQVALAADQVELADQARQGAESAEAAALTYAQASEAGAGIPPAAANSFLGTDSSGNPLWKSVVIQAIGDVLYSANPPSAEYKLADGSIYLQASYAGWVLKFPTPVSTPSTRLSLGGFVPTAVGTVVTVMTSADGVYTVIASNSTSGQVPTLRCIKRTGDTFTQLANLPTTVVSTAALQSAAMSDDGVYLMAAYNTAPFLETFKRTGDAWTRLANPVVLPASAVSGPVACSGDGVYWFLREPGGSSTIARYKRTGDAFALLASVTLSGNVGASLFAVNFDCSYLAVANGTPTLGSYITVYKRAGDTLSALSNTSAFPTPISALPTAMAFSDDASHLAVSHGTASANTRIFKRTGDVFDQTYANTFGTSSATSIDLSDNAKFVVFGNSQTSVLLQRNGEAWAGVPGYASPEVAGGAIGGIVGARFSHDATYLNNFLILGGLVSPYLAAYRDSYPYNPLTEFQVPLLTGLANGVTAGNTATNTKPPQVAAYVKLKDSA